MTSIPGWHVVCGNADNGSGQFVTGIQLAHDCTLVGVTRLGSISTIAPTYMAGIWELDKEPPATQPYGPFNLWRGKLAVLWLPD